MKMMALNSFSVLSLLSLILFSYSHAKETSPRPICDSKMVTRNCEFFKEHAKETKIELADGTSFKNPLYDPVQSSNENSGDKKTSDSGSYSVGTGNSYGVGGGYQLDPEALRNQAAAYDLMDGTGLTTEFRMTVVPMLSYAMANPTATLKVPWPADQKRAPLVDVKISQIMATVKKKLGTQKFAQLSKLNQKQLEKWKKVQEANQQQMEKTRIQMEQTQKEQDQIQQKLQERSDRLNDLFVFARERIEDVLKNDASMTEEERKALYDKVHSLKLKDVNSLEVINSQGCSGAEGNAFYDHNNEVILCPQFKDLPDAQIVFILAHEIGHSIDECNSQLPQWRVNSEKMDAFLKSRSFTPMDLKRLEKFTNAKAKEYYYYEPSLEFDDASVANDLVKAGVLTKVHDGVPYARFPFRQQHSCLVKRAGFREITKQDVLDTTNFLKKESRFVVPEDQPGVDKLIQRYEAAMLQYPQCLRAASYHSQMGEVLGDVLGTVVQDQYLQSHAAKNEADKIGQVPFISDTCSKNSDDKSKATAAPAAISSGFFEVLNDSHPLTPRRISDIIFSTPQTEARFNCVRKAPSCFEDLLISPVSTSNSSSAGGTK